MSLVQVTDRELDLAEHLTAVRDDRCGAVASFLGQVRNHDPGADGAVSAIEYSAHPDAEQVLIGIVRELSGAVGDAVPGGVVQIAVSHRIGDLIVGDLALVVCVATAHRAQAYEISRNLVERIKVELPVWKKQHTADGTSHWSGL